MPDRDEDDMIGGEGPMSRYTYKEAYALTTGMHSEMANENQRLRAELERSRTAPLSPSPVEPEPRAGPDWGVVQGEDKEAATAELKTYTEGVVDDLYAKRKTQDDAKTFPADRANAKAYAENRIRQAGGDPAKFSDAVDKAMGPQSGITPEQQTDPNFWYQAFVLAEGASAISGRQPGRGTEVHVERPTRGPSGAPSDAGPSDSRWEEGFEPGVEKRAKTRWEEQTGEKIPMEEWVELRDMTNVQEYEEMMAKRKSNTRRGR